MTEIRTKLSLRIAAASLKQREHDAVSVLGQAIEHHFRVRWTYNKVAMQAEPQLLYRRNGALHCDAVVAEKNGARPDEARLATFRLSGLRDVILTTEALSPFDGIDLLDPRYAEGIVAKL